MNNWIKCIASFLATVIVTSTAFGQDEKAKTIEGNNNDGQEIVIRKKKGNSEKMTIVVDGDNVTINGKPVDEFKNKDISVFKRDRLAMPRPRAFTPGRDLFDAEQFDHFFSASNRAMLGIMTEKADDGVRVREVTKESGAEKAGLKKDDIITKVGDKEVKEPRELTEAIATYKPNDKVEITYKRDGKQSKTSATLGESKSRAFSYNLNNRDFNFHVPTPPVPPMDNFNFNLNYGRKPKIGLQIQDVEEGKGAKVTDVDSDSPAAKAGLKDGDVITQVNGKEVAGVEQVRDAIREVNEGETVRFSYRRDGKNQSAEIKIPKRLRTAEL